MVGKNSVENSGNNSKDKGFQTKRQDVFDFQPRPSPEASNKEPSPDGKHKRTVILVSVVAGLILLIFVFRPNILGLGVYSQEQSSDTLNELGQQETAEQGTESYGMQDLGKSLQELRTELSSQNNQLSDLLENDISRITADFAFCLTEKSSLEDSYQSRIAAFQSDILEKSKVIEEQNQRIQAFEAQDGEKSSGLREEMKSLQEEVKAVQSRFDALAKSTAYSICCKHKVDNNRINYYDISNNKIACLEEGTLALNCFS